MDFGSGYIVSLSFVGLEIEPDGLESIPIKLKTVRECTSMIDIVRKASIANVANISQGPIKVMFSAVTKMSQESIERVYSVEL